MIVALDRKYGEMSIYGSPAEYRHVAELIRAGDGVVDLDAEADVDPYDEPLARFVVRRTDATTVTFARDDRDIVLTGPAKFLTTVAEMFEDAAGLDKQGHHIHIDPFPGHFFLDERSASVILNDPGWTRLGAEYRKWRAEQPPSS